MGLRGEASEMRPARPPITSVNQCALTYRRLLETAAITMPEPSTAARRAQRDTDSAHARYRTIPQKMTTPKTWPLGYP
jgi:hypothetical protein